MTNYLRINEVTVYEITLKKKINKWMKQDSDNWNSLIRVKKIKDQEAYRQKENVRKNEFGK